MVKQNSRGMSGKPNKWNKFEKYSAHWKDFCCEILSSHCCVLIKKKLLVEVTISPNFKFQIIELKENNVSSLTMQ